MKLIIAFAVSLIAANSEANQTYPGTSYRPILSANEAAGYTTASFLHGWTPQRQHKLPTKVHYAVGGIGGYRTIQAAVNAAIKTKSRRRKYIKINSGKYDQVVSIPATTVPLTIYGAGALSSDTVITLDISSTLSGNDYQELVTNLFAKGDPAFQLYTSCAIKAPIGTACSSVVRIEADNVELINLTIENSSKLPYPAVALMINADKVHLRNCRLLGRHGTLYVGTDVSRLLRNYFHIVYIEGIKDFVFGSASAVFDICNIYVKDHGKQAHEAVIFAPSTVSTNKYGFLVIDGVISGGHSWYKSRRVYLARNWDAAGSSINGQVVVRNTQMDAIFPVDAPYAASTSGKAYSGNNRTDRNLNDYRYNRFWECFNIGPGAFE